jgi:DNA-binding transcriptional ArsR family regulator
VPSDIGRPSWNLSAFNGADSPERYRTLYRFAATNLNLATGLWIVTRYLCNPSDVQGRYSAILVAKCGRLSSICLPNRDGIRALREALQASVELFRISHSSIENHSKRRSQRFPRFILTQRVVRSLSYRDYGPFLKSEVRPASLSLIAGALQLRDNAGLPESPRPLTRPNSATRPLEPTEVASTIDAGLEPDRRAIVSWLEQQRELSKRSHYNLACYYSRELMDGSVEPGSLLEPIVRHLGRAISLSSDETSAALQESAKRDPSLLLAQAQWPEQLASLLGTDPATVADEEPALDVNDHGDVPIPLVEDRTTRMRLNDRLVILRYRDQGLLRRERFLTNARSEVKRIETVPPGESESDASLLGRILFLPLPLPESDGDPPEQGQ